MFNIFKIKKFSALILSCVVSTVLFAVGSIYYGVFGGIIFFLIGILLCVILGNILLNNPFSSMLEGKGILALDMTSTGVIRPFIVSVVGPYIEGKHDGKEVRDIFDRESTYNLATPVTSSNKAVQSKNGLNLSLSEEDYNKSRFGMLQYPVLIYNSQIRSFLTKDFFSDAEKSSFAEHHVLYLNRNVEDLSSYVRDFGRGIVELLKPRGKMGNWWLWLLIGGFIIIMLALFGPSILNVLGGTASTANSAFSGVTQSASSAIMPI